MRVGMILVGLGSALALSGVLPLGGGDTAGAVTVTVPEPTVPESSVVMPSSSSPTTLPPATSTTSTTTTAAATTIPYQEAIATFIVEFGHAIAVDDVEWLFGTLNPAIVLEYGEDLCRGFIANDILALGDYTLTGAVSGPETKTFATGVGELTIPNVYTADTSFVFQGELFEAKADFVYDDTVTWLAICR